MNKLIYKYYGIVSSYSLIDFLFGFAFIAFMSMQGLSNSEIGKILFLWSTIIVITGIPFAIFADSFGRKNCMILGFLIWSIGLYLFSISNNVIYFSASIIFITIGMTFIGQLPVAWFVSSLSSYEKADQIQGKSIPFANGISKFISFASGIIFTYVIVKTDSGFPYLLASIISLVTSIIIFFFYKEAENFKLEKSDKFSIPFIKFAYKNIIDNKTLILFF